MQLQKGDKVQYIGEDLMYSYGLHIYRLKKNAVYTISIPMDGIFNCVVINDERDTNQIYPCHDFIKVGDTDAANS